MTAADRTIGGANWRGALPLCAIAGLAVALRIAAAIVLNQPLESDALAYFTMAKELADHGVVADQFGNRAFYSIAYPLLLSPAFLLLGATVPVAIAVNCALAAASVWLTHRMATLLSGNLAGLIAALVFACWLPAIWTASGVGKENLSIPLLLALAYCALQIAHSATAVRWAFGAGLAWGASLLAGGSSILLCAGVGVALILMWRRRKSLTQALTAGIAFTMAASFVLAPWLYATNRMIGKPVLTTNAAFNLYLGNNPAADGRFVSMRDTPLGTADWNRIRIERGEVGAAAFLQDEARNWIAAHPLQATQLAFRKLIYFWQPNVPDAADFRASRLISAVRLVEVAQYAIILLAGLLAFRSPAISRDHKWVVAATITGFWLVHAAAYIIARYRDPAIPLLIAMGSAPVARWLQQRAGLERAARDGL